MVFYEINSIRRSGHHAFIYWLISNFYDTLIENHFYKWNNIADDFIYINEAEFEIHHSQNFIDREYLTLNTLITSTETSPETTGISTPELREKWGVTEHKHIVFIRDFYNCLASQIKAGSSEFWETETEYSLLIYNSYKSQLKSIVEGKTYGVIYDQWVLGQDYCNQVCLDLLNKHNKFNPIECKGTSSSFDSTQNNLNNLLNRHQGINFPFWLIKKSVNDKELNKMLNHLNMVTI